MQIHILMYDEGIERASVNGRKMNLLADEMNGGPDIFGPYFVASVELEDIDESVNCDECHEARIKGQTDQ